MRKDLQEAGIIKEGVLQENQLFNSPSYAATFILGEHTNGRTDWKEEQGASLRDLEEQEIKE